MGAPFSAFRCVLFAHRSRARFANERRPVFLRFAPFRFSPVVFSCAFSAVLSNGFSRVLSTYTEHEPSSTSDLIKSGSNVKISIRLFLFSSFALSQAQLEERGLGLIFLLRSISPGSFSSRSLSTISTRLNCFFEIDPLSTFGPCSSEPQLSPITLRPVRPVPLVFRAQSRNGGE